MSFGIPVRNGLGIGLSAYATISSKKPLWTPAQLPTALWMDANDANTITLNGTTVSQWSDKSGNSRNVSQATAVSQPLYVTGQNYLLYSEQLQQADWVKINFNVDADAIAAPNGTLTADKLSENNVNGFHLARKSFTFVANTKYTLSAYCKKAERNIFCFNPFIGGVGGVVVFFNVTSGTVALSTQTGWTINSSAITPVGNDWYRCSVTFTVGATGGAGIVDIAPCLSPGVVNYLGVTGYGAYLWGAQLQLGDLGTYQLTEAVAITSGTVNNRPALSFDGIDDFLTIGSTGLLRFVPGSSAFVVGQWISVPTVSRSIISILSGAGNARFQLGSITNFPKFEAGGRRLDSNSFQLAASSTQNITTTNHFIQSAVVDYVATLGQQWINGTLDGQNAAFQTSGNTSNTNSNAAIIGAGTTGGGQAANINIGEIIILPQAVSLETRQQFEGYLAWKWQMQGSLPIGHPYKNAPPTV
jgi:hypothetical protein